MTYTKKILVSILVLSGLAAGSISNAHAGTVETSAAELSTAAGAQQVYSRIYAAALADCNDQFVSPYAVKTKLRYERCIRASVKYMVADIAHPKLDFVFAESKQPKTKSSRPVLSAKRVR